MNIRAGVTLTRLGVPLTVHHVAVQRAADAAGRIEAALTEAQRTGAMRAFNAEYRRRREAASAVGKGFMSYASARSRLRAAIAGVIAKGGERLDLAAVRSVFE
jgi:hypothetical protein